jgi:uncharacterized protein (DUF1330 family)
MSAYLILDIDVRDVDTYMKYVATAPDFVKKHGGTYRVRGGDPAGLEGDWQPTRIVVVEFPDRDAAMALLNDPGYREIAPNRWNATVSNTILVDGCDGPV